MAKLSISSFRKKKMKRECLRIGVNTVRAFTHPQFRRTLRHIEEVYQSLHRDRPHALLVSSAAVFWDVTQRSPHKTAAEETNALHVVLVVIILTLMVFCCRVLFPGTAIPAPYPKASQTGENNTRRTNTQIKHPKTLVAIFLKAIRFSNNNDLALLQDDFRILEVWV